MNTLHRLYVAVPDDWDTDNLGAPELAAGWLVRQHGFGVTVTAGVGVEASDDPAVVPEFTLIVDILTDRSDHDVKPVAEALRQNFHQNSVMHLALPAAVLA